MSELKYWTESLEKLKTSKKKSASHMELLTFTENLLTKLVSLNDEKNATIDKLTKELEEANESNKSLREELEIAWKNSD